MVKKLETVFDNKIWNSVAGILFPILLVLFAFMHINEGITVTDTGYNYGNFVFFDGLDDMWKFSTYLSNAIGTVFTHLPFGQTMMGLNFYTGLLKIAAALVVYFFCIKVCKMRKEVAFFGEVIALGFCWCPTALIYNYLTYFLFHIAALFVYLAIVKDDKKYYVFGGIALGLNLFVRLPNAAEVALIFAVWLGAVLYQKGIKKAVFDTLYCVLGYVLGAGAVFVYIVCRYGLNRYIKGIKALFSMTSEAESYTVKAMIVDTVRVYVQYSRWFVYGLLLILIGVLLFKLFGKKFIILKKCAFVGILVVAIYFFRRWGMFWTNYRGYESIFGWGVLLLTVCLVLCAYIILFSKHSIEEKVMASIVCLIILITPLGSNNHLYSPINNLFLAAPFFMNYVWNLLSDEKSSIMVGKSSFAISPYKITMAVLGLVLVVQGILFGANFVFRDGGSGEVRNYLVEENKVLKGMKTTRINAINLQELNAYLVDNELTGSDVVLFGNVPSLAFYFELTPVLSSTWPDLPSFSVAKLEAEIDSLEEQDRLPMIIMSSNPKEIGKHEESKESLKNKLKKIEQFMENNAYVQTFSNDAFTIYMSK